MNRSLYFTTNFIFSIIPAMIAVFLVPLLFTGCDHHETPGTATNRSKVRTVVSDRYPQKGELGIIFEGLAAMIPMTVDSTNSDVLALLPDAKYTSNATYEELPPGVGTPGTRVSASDQMKFPSHEAYLWFDNANVVNGTTPIDTSLPIPIQGIEVNFQTGKSHVPKGSVKLDQLLNKSLAEDIYQNSLSLPSQWDQVNGDYLKADFLNRDDFPELAARIKLSGADYINGNTICDQAQCPDGLTYLLAAPSAQPTCHEASFEAELAQHTVVGVEGWLATSKLTIELKTLNSGGPAPSILTATIVDPNKPLVVWVANTTDGAQKRPLIPGSSGYSCPMDDHLEAFRWFYSLSVGVVKANTAAHLFPCEECNSGDTKCPQRQMTP